MKNILINIKTKNVRQNPCCVGSLLQYISSGNKQAITTVNKMKQVVTLGIISNIYGKLTPKSSSVHFIILILLHLETYNLLIIRLP